MCEPRRAETEVAVSPPLLDSDQGPFGHHEIIGLGEGFQGHGPDSPIEAGADDPKGFLSCYDGACPQQVESFVAKGPSPCLVVEAFRDDTNDGAI